VQNFTFIDAVKKLPTNFSSSEVRPILLRAGNRFAGRLRSTFVVLDDDTTVSRKTNNGKGATSRSDKATEAAEAAETCSANEDEDEDSRFVQVQTGASRKRRPDSAVGSLAKKIG